MAAATATVAACGLLLSFVASPPPGAPPPERVEADHRLQRLLSLAAGDSEIDVITQALADLTRELVQHPNDNQMLVVAISPGCINVSEQPAAPEQGLGQPLK